MGDTPAKPRGENGKAGLKPSAGEEGVFGAPNGCKPYSPNNLEARLEGGKNAFDALEVGKVGVGIFGDGVLELLLTSIGDNGVCGKDNR